MQTKDGFSGQSLILTCRQSIRKDSQAVDNGVHLKHETKQTKIVINHQDGGDHGCHDGNHPPSSSWLVQMIDIIILKIRTRLLFMC